MTDKEMIEAKVATMMDESCDVRWGFEQGAIWALQQRTEQSGWRKVQIDDAEEEAWKELEKKNKVAFKSWLAWYSSPPENWNEKYGDAFVWTEQEKALMQQFKEKNT